MSNYNDEFQRQEYYVSSMKHDEFSLHSERDEFDELFFHEDEFNLDCQSEMFRKEFETSETEESKFYDNRKANNNQRKRVSKNINKIQNQSKNRDRQSSSQGNTNGLKVKDVLYEAPQRWQKFLL